MSHLANPATITFPGANPEFEAPEILSIHYDLWLLRISLNFENRSTPVYVNFPRIAGFRVLDEGDLLEFWNPDARANGWLWEIKSGGWFDLESTRSGFVSSHQDKIIEYFVRGENECVSVLSFSEPEIHEIAP